MATILVCVPAKTNLVPEGGYAPDLRLESTPAPVGWLRGFETAGLADNEMVAAELRSIGLDLVYYVAGAKAEHGSIVFVMTFAVEVPTLEEAQKLPGFELFGIALGPYLMPPDKTWDDTFTPSDVFDDLPIRRVPVADAYTNIEPPPYDENGAFSFSMIPLGRLGQLVFLREDPLHFYSLPFGELRKNPNGDGPIDAVALCRRFLATQRHG